MPSWISNLDLRVNVAFVNIIYGRRPDKEGSTMRLLQMLWQFKDYEFSYSNWIVLDNWPNLGPNNIARFIMLAIMTITCHKKDNIDIIIL